MSHPYAGRFDGRVAIVTGAGQGIGEATALMFASQGAAVGVVDVDADHAAKVVAQIQDAGGRALALQCDVSSPEQVEAAVTRTVEELGGLHILVNNAGIVRDARIHKMAVEDFEAVINVNLKGAWLFSKAAQKHMVPQRYGKIVMTSSRSALGGNGQTNYSSAKAGMLGLASALAWDLGPFNINVNSVAPGHVTTDMTKGTAERLGQDYEEIRAARIKASAVKKVAVPSDIADIIGYLASDEAGILTGQVLYATGRPLQ